jgi:hypothetical protein
VSGARRSGLTLPELRAAGPPRGRPARWGLGCPSPCGALRGLQLRGGSSLLGWERPAGQGGTRAFPGRSGAGHTSRARPAHFSPGRARLPGARPPAGPGSQPAGAAALATGSVGRQEAALPPQPRGVYWGTIWRLLGRERSCPGWRRRRNRRRNRARRTGTAATPAEQPGLLRPSLHKHKALRKLFPKKSWEDYSLFSHPERLLFLEGDRGLLFSRAASSPTLASSGPRARALARKPGLESGSARQLLQGSAPRGKASAFPSPAGGGQGATGPVPKPVRSLTLPHFPAQSLGIRSHLRLRHTATQQ